MAGRSSASSIFHRFFNHAEIQKKTLPLQNTDLGISTEVKIENLEHFFENNTDMWSDTFGQDWRIQVQVSKTKDECPVPTIGVFFRVGFLLNPMKLRITFTLRTLAGISDKTITFEREMSSKEGRGYLDFVTKSYLFEQHRRFKQDNACILAVTVQSKELFRPTKNLEGIIRPAPKIALARSLVMPSIVDTKFLLFNSRVKDGARLSHVRAVYSNSQMLRSIGPYFESSERALCYHCPSFECVTHVYSAALEK